MNVLVTGATGFVGCRLVPALVEAGHDVRALSRNPTGYDPPEGVEVVAGNLLEPGSLEGVFDGIEAVYYLVHSIRAGGDVEEMDRTAARNFADAAGAAGVERVVYLGGLGEEQDDLSPHLRSRREVECILEGGDYALTTLRAAISDVIASLVGVLDAPETAGHAYGIGGPEVLTYREMLQRTANAIGRCDPLIVPIPVLTPKLSAYWVGPVTDVSWQVAQPLILGLENPVVVTDDSIRDHVDVELTHFETTVERALAEGRGPGAGRGTGDETSSWEATGGPTTGGQASGGQEGGGQAG